MDMQLLLKLMNTLGQMRQHQSWTRSQLEAYQAGELLRLREYAYARSPFYQRFHKGLTDWPLQELPILTKATVMENFNDVVTDVHSSRGSAGTHGE
jgi:phenylacetate-coenzyme A ligase PaaK-like adenylate-forming protein